MVIPMVLFYGFCYLYFSMKVEFNKGQYDFNKDLITGEQGQEFIAEFMTTKGFTYVKSCTNILHDLEMSYNGKTYTYEVKTDVYPRDTGNLVIEFECRGKASGINATDADYFTYFFPNLGEIWNIKTTKLKKLIEDYKPLIFSNAGDKKSQTKLYRLRKKDVASYFSIHKVSAVIP